MASLSALISRVSELARTMGDSLQLRGFKPGGTEGQVPVKGAGGDFDWEWESVSGVGGGVTTFAELTDKVTANIPAINSYVAPKASPTFTGTVTIPSGALISGYLTSAAAALAYQPLSSVLTATTASFTTTIAARLANTSGTNTGDQTYTTLTGGEANYVPMDITPTGIPTTEGTLSWNADDHTLNVQTDIPGTVIQVGLESLTRVRNVSGSTIANGSVVYINGSSGQRPTVARAISTNDTHALSTIGLATADIAHNAFGFITIVGLVRGIDTTGIVEGTPLYLSASIAGAVTATPPTTNRIRVGWVAIESNNGTVLVGVEKQSVKSSEVSDATDANTANMIVKRDASGRASLELHNATISGTVTFSGTGQTAMREAIGTMLDAAVITGTSTTPGLPTPAQLKLAAEEHGGAGGGSGTTIVTLAADTAPRTLTTTYANETGIVLPTLEANKPYRVEWGLILSTGAGGIKTQLQVPSSKNVNAFATGWNGQSSSLAGVTASGTTPKYFTTGTRAGANALLPICGSAIIYTDSTGGVPQLQWAQNSSDAADSKLLAGSFVAVTPMF